MARGSHLQERLSPQDQDVAAAPCLLLAVPIKTCFALK
jgi:hypothetical protein